MGDNNFEIGATEALEILKFFELEEITKIDKNLLDVLEESKIPDYECQFDYNLPINDWKINPVTKNILAMIAYNYWCEDDEQRELIAKKLRDNQIKFNRSVDPSNSMMIQEEKWNWKNILNFIKKSANKTFDTVYKKINNI